MAKHDDVHQLHVIYDQAIILAFMTDRSRSHVKIILHYYCILLTFVTYMYNVQVCMLSVNYKIMT